MVLAITTTLTRQCESWDSKLTVANLDCFQRFQVAKIDDEWLWVSRVGKRRLHVRRGFGPTPATPHGEGAAIAIIGVAVPEGYDQPTNFMASYMAVYGR